MEIKLLTYMANNFRDVITQNSEFNRVSVFVSKECEYNLTWNESEWKEFIHLNHITFVCNSDKNYLRVKMKMTDKIDNIFQCSNIDVEFCKASGKRVTKKHFGSMLDFSNFLMDNYKKKK